MVKLKARKLCVSLQAKDVINKMIADDWCRLFKVQAGKVYLLLHHYKHLNVNDAKRMLVCDTTSKDGQYYITHPLK